MNWKVGDTCLYKCDLAEITQIDDGVVVGLQFPNGSSSYLRYGYDAEILPALPASLIYGVQYMNLSNRIHDRYPQIDYYVIWKWMQKQWYNACCATTEDAVAELWVDALNVEREIHEKYNVSVRGFALFRGGNAYIEAEYSEVGKDE